MARGTRRGTAGKEFKYTRFISNYNQTGNVKLASGFSFNFGFNLPLLERHVRPVRL